MAAELAGKWHAGESMGRDDTLLLA